MSTPSCASFTEKGLREKNEDASLAVEVQGMYLFAVAEGMGGPEEGPSAAEIAVNALRDGIPQEMTHLPDVLESCLINADTALYSLQEANPTSEPPAVSMTLAVVRPGGECVVNSPGQRKLFFIDRGVHAGEGTDRGDGNEGFLHDPGAGMHEAHLPPGFLVICSDGVTDFLSDNRILEIISERGDDLDDACHKIVYEAFQNGSDDNMTVVMVRQPET